MGASILLFNVNSRPNTLLTCSISTLLRYKADPQPMRCSTYGNKKKLHVCEAHNLHTTVPQACTLLLLLYVDTIEQSLTKLDALEVLLYQIV